MHTLLLPASFQDGLGIKPVQKIKPFCILLQQDMMELAGVLTSGTLESAQLR